MISPERFFSNNSEPWLTSLLFDINFIPVSAQFKTLMEAQLKIFSFLQFGIKLKHTEISYNGYDYAFGRYGLSCSPSNIDKTLFGFELQRVISLGTSNYDPERFHEFVRNTVHRFNRESYDLFSRNCRHFSVYLIQELAPTDPEEGKTRFMSFRD